MPMEEPHKFLVYPWTHKELTFEWLVIQVGEGLSENCEEWGTHIHRAFLSAYGQCVKCFHGQSLLCPSLLYKC